MCVHLKSIQTCILSCCYKNPQHFISDLVSSFILSSGNGAYQLKAVCYGKRFQMPILPCWSVWMFSLFVECFCIALAHSGLAIVKSQCNYRLFANFEAPVIWNWLMNLEYYYGLAGCWNVSLMTGSFFIFVSISLTLFQGPPGRAGFPVIVSVLYCPVVCLSLSLSRTFPSL